MKHFEIIIKICFYLIFGYTGCFCLWTASYYGCEVVSYDMILLFFIGKENGRHFIFVTSNDTIEFFGAEVFLSYVQQIVGGEAAYGLVLLGKVFFG